MVSIVFVDIDEATSIEIDSQMEQTLSKEHYSLKSILCVCSIIERFMVSIVFVDIDEATSIEIDSQMEQAKIYTPYYVDIRTSRSRRMNFTLSNLNSSLL